MSEAIRLNAHNREIIRDRALASAFDERRERLAKAEDRMARKFYNRVIPLKERKLLEQLGERWLHHSLDLPFNVGGMKLAFKLIAVDEKDPGLPVPLKSTYYNADPIGSIADPDETEAAIEHFDAVKALKEEHLTAYKTLEAMLARIPTVKALRSMWPEGEAFYSDISPVRSMLPMPMIADVNAMLGLAV